MARFSLITSSLALLVLFHGCLARQTSPPRLGESQFMNECQLDNLDALEPTETVQCEGGRMEYWDHNNPQLRCAGVAVVRRVIEPNSLYLPTFHASPQLTYVVRGKGLVGRIVPGCAETYMDSQGLRGQQGRGQGRSQAEWGEHGQQFRDLHQKVEHIHQGHVVAWPAGTAHWCYNSGNEPLVVVSLIDIGNSHNQLDRNPRSFHLAGNNPQGRQFQLGRQGSGQQQQSNLFSGFDARFIAEAFNIDENTARQLQNKDDQRGNIVRIRGSFQVVRPPSRSEFGEEQRERYQPGRDGVEMSEQSNGLEETFCTMKLHENIDNPERADVYKPQLGRITNVNSFTLPVLRWLRLSATRGVIHGNAMVLPKWNINANEILYCTRGRAHVQVVNDNGQSVFDQEIRENQLVVIPQGYAFLKRASQQSDRFEWISFKTNDNAKTNTLAGRTSAMRAIPLAVIQNAFQISPEEARRVKFNTQETTLTHARGSMIRETTADA